MNILILDDHPPIVEFVAIKLQELNNKLIILKANNVGEALGLLGQHEIDRVICDLQIISGKNLEIPRYCGSLQIPFMVYSSYVSYSLIKELNECNITCYVSKGSLTDHLIEGLNNLLQNSAYFCPTVLKERINFRGSDITRPNLTKSEYKVVQAFASGMSTVEVANYLSLEIVTIRNHRARASDKNSCSFTELVARFKYWED